MSLNGETTTTAEANSPVLERILNRVLRCSHRQLGRPITLDGESFAVCLDCGKRIAYDLRAFRTRRPYHEGGKPKTSLPPQQGPREPERGSRPRCDVPGSQVNTRRRKMLWGSVLAISLAFASFYLANQGHPRRNRI